MTAPGRRTGELLRADPRLIKRLTNDVANRLARHGLLSCFQGRWRVEASGTSDGGGEADDPVGSRAEEDLGSGAQPRDIIGSKSLRSPLCLRTLDSRLVSLSLFQRSTFFA